jgi:signal transduction histidine kinase
MDSSSATPGPDTDLAAERQRYSILFEVTDRAARATSVGAVYELALDSVQSALGVTRSAILIFDQQGVMRFVAWRGLSDSYRHAVEGHSPWKIGESDPRPLFVADADADPAWTSYRALFEAEHIKALGFVPLVNDGKLIGKFMIYSDLPRSFTHREVELAQAIAAQVAQAVVYRQREEAREAARKAAEETARAKEALLAIASHDLKNPLSVIITTAEGLKRTGTENVSPARLERSLNILLRAAGNMRELIHSILDFAELSAGRAALKLETLPVHTLLEECAELLQPLADTRKQSLVVGAPAAIQITCDKPRIFQVLSNVIANAIRFSPSGGTIVMAASAAGREAVVSVSDQGPGISAQDADRIFEPYWHGGPSLGDEVGLGLTIARGLVEAHGGRIWAESAPGGGSTFRFTLPIAAPRTRRHQRKSS